VHGSLGEQCQHGTADVGAPAATPAAPATEAARLERWPPGAEREDALVVWMIMVCAMMTYHRSYSNLLSMR